MISFFRNMLWGDTPLERTIYNKNLMLLFAMFCVPFIGLILFMIYSGMPFNYATLILIIYTLIGTMALLYGVLKITKRRIAYFSLPENFKDKLFSRKYSAYTFWLLMSAAGEEKLKCSSAFETSLSDETTAIRSPFVLACEACFLQAYQMLGYLILDGMLIIYALFLLPNMFINNNQWDLLLGLFLLEVFFYGREVYNEFGFRKNKDFAANFIEPVFPLGQNSYHHGKAEATNLLKRVMAAFAGISLLIWNLFHKVIALLLVVNALIGHWVFPATFHFIPALLSIFGAILIYFVNKQWVKRYKTLIV